MPRCAVIAPVAAFTVILGCGPDHAKEPRGDESARYAKTLCDAIASCGCQDFFASAAACEAEYAGRFEELQDAGLDLDVDCFEEVIDEEEDVLSCSTTGTPPAEWRCRVLRGDKARGEACSDHHFEVPPFDVSECSGDLICLDGICSPFGVTGPDLGVGDSCFAEQEWSCHVGGIYCAEDGICRAEPLVGEACTSPTACAFDLDGSPATYCAGLAEGTGTCAVALMPGESCDPRDWFACGVGWCDPAQDVCRETIPAVCGMTSFPNARPDGQ